jgi:hydroxyethylthiazole kinase-like uncharacterized protein yjeF
MAMQRVLPAARTLPLFDVQRSRAIEQRAAAALPPHTLMRRAGEAVAHLALAVAPHARRVWVAAGPGNNGGDGLEAAIHLQRAGRDVAVSLHGDPARLPDDARAAFARAQAAGVALVADRAWLAQLDPDDLAIDALLGNGARRAPDAALAAAIAQLASLRCPVLAVDLPSGLAADTGAPLGEALVRADHTLALLTLKPGLFTGSGRDAAGTVWIDDLGVDPGAEAPGASLAGIDALHEDLRPRRHALHKGSFGDVAIVGGAAGMTGAVLLAAQAASHAGAGRVYVQLLDGGSIGVDAAHAELMFRPQWSSGSIDALGASTAVCGCGGGTAIAAVLARLLSTVPRIVIDADGLNAIATDPSLATLLAARAGRGWASVLTPHPLEAARLLATTAAAVQSDRLAAASALAAQLRCVVLLKGSGSVVAAVGRPASINPTGNAALASAGTGDVLAGWIGGTWSARAGFGAPSADSAFDCAVAAAVLHGAAVRAVRCGPLPASALIEAMRHTRSRLARGEIDAA